MSTREWMGNLETRAGYDAINKYFIQSVGRRMVVYYWYQSKRRIIANEYSGKVLLITDTLRDGRSAGGLVRIMVADNLGWPKKVYPGPRK